MNPRLLVALALTCLAACTPGPTGPTAPAYQALGVSALTPALGATLSKGSSVELSLTLVSYMSVAGRVTLSVRDQGGVSLLASEPGVDLEARSEATVHASFGVPLTASSVEVLATFRPTGQDHPTVVLRVGYPTR